MNRFGAIFDWDGTVVDSSRLHAASWEQLAVKEGRPVPDLSRIGSLGMKTQAVISDLLGWTQDPKEVVRLTLHKEELFRCLARRTGMDSIPGVLEFLRSLRAFGVPAAIGSSAPRLNIEAGLEVLDAHGFFAAIVSGDDVTNGKPAPDIFLKAAEAIQCRPENCVVFEDAPVGVAAGKAAGMKVVGLLTAYPADVLRESDLLVEDFRGLSASGVAGWMEPENDLSPRT